jgi:hypothetical protein
MEACGDQTSHICNCAFNRRISLSFWASGACFGGMLNTCACSLMCCRFVTFRKRGSDPQLAVDTTQRNPIGAIRVQPLRIAVGLPRGYMMSAPFRFETQESLAQELRNVTPSSPTFDRDLAVRDLAVKIGSRIAVRRSLCGLSKLQLGERLGIDAAEVSAYEQGEKRMSCRLLLETAKQLKAAPCFFFQ